LILLLDFIVSKNKRKEDFYLFGFFKKIIFIIGQKIMIFDNITHAKNIFFKIGNLLEGDYPK